MGEDDEEAWAIGELEDTSLQSSKAIDVIGPWTERKYEIEDFYAQLYSNILDQTDLDHWYIDGYAASGYGFRRETKELIEASVSRVLSIKPPFKQYHLVEIDPKRLEMLRARTKKSPNIFLYEGDANLVLPRIFSEVRFDQLRRAFCLLDPYKLQDLRWETICAAAKPKTIDLLLHFPIMDANRNALWRTGDAEQSEHLTRYWGDASWKQVLYNANPSLFGDVLEKKPNDAVVKAFSDRLKSVAGFQYVSKPIPMRNTRRATLYYLIFAVHHKTAFRVVSDVAKRFLKLEEN
jgi:three-Cys-motif partner protein